MASSDIHGPDTNGPVFAGLFGWFVLLHTWKQLPLDESGFVTAMRVLAVAPAAMLVVRPNHLGALAATASGIVLCVLAQLPLMSNSWMAAGCLSVAVLLGVALASQSGARTTADAWSHIQPGIAAGLLAFYLFASLCKFNVDFVTPGTSCAEAFYGELARDLPLPTASWAIQLAIGGTLLIEAGIPVLLAIPRTRTLGILVGLVFHAFIAISARVHIFDFSLLMYTGYVAFAPADLHRVLRTDPNLRMFRPVFARPRLLLLLLFGVALLAGLASAGTDWTRSLLVRAVVWDLVAACIIGGSFVALLRCEQPNPSLLPALRRPAAWAAVALITLNGISPYIGLKTTVAFTMFSNLRTEAGVANHLFVPRLPVFGFQDEVLTVERTTLPIRTDDVAWLPFTLRGFATTHPDATIAYRVNGDPTLTYDGPLSEDPRLNTPVSPVLGKMLSFRPIELGAKCPW